jgi:hypothetical protein
MTAITAHYAYKTARNTHKICSLLSQPAPRSEEVARSTLEKGKSSGYVYLHVLSANDELTSDTRLEADYVLQTFPRTVYPFQRHWKIPATVSMVEPGTPNFADPIEEVLGGMDTWLDPNTIWFFVRNVSGSTGIEKTSAGDPLEKPRLTQYSSGDGGSFNHWGEIDDSGIYFPQ